MSKPYRLRARASVRRIARAVVLPLEPRTLLHAGHDGLFINAGGQPYVDTAGHDWVADRHFAGGEAKSGIYDVANTPNDAIFATRRFGPDFSYDIPVAAQGTYRVTLYMAEPWFTAPGQRVFSVSAEGTTHLRDFDLLTAAASRTAVKRWFDARVTDGTLNLRFVSSTDNAIVSGFSVERVAQIPTAPSSLKATATAPTQVALSWTDTSTEETGFAIDRSIDTGANWTQVAVVNANVTSYTDTGLSAMTNYQYRIRATSAAGASAPSASVGVRTPAVSSPSISTPFAGAPIRLPGTIQAENFDVGPIKVAFDDMTPSNAGGVYRQTDVDVYRIPPTAEVPPGTAASTSPQYAVGSIRPGEWLAYSVDVAKAGKFTLSLAFASASPGGTAEVALGGQTLWSDIALTGTGAWSRYSVIDLPARDLPAGKHVLRLSFVSAGRPGHDIGNIDWLRFAQVSVANPNPQPQPDPTGPAAPASLAVAAVGAAQVNLSWIDQASDEIGYRIERRVSGTTAWMRLTDLPANSTWYVDQSVAPTTAYNYRVTARGANQTTPATSSAVKSATTSGITGFAWSGTVANPQPRYEAAGVAANGRLYTFGGFVNNLIQATARVDAFDPARGAWRRMSDMPEVVTHAGHAVDGPFVYIGGGFIGDHPGLGSTSVWRYDTRDDSWRRMPDLPGPRGAGAMAIVARELHFFGGLVRSQFVTQNQAEHWVLDLTAPSLGWKKRADLPNPRNHLTAVELNGKIYAIGGQDLWNEVSGAMAHVDVFDYKTNTWSAAAPLPVARSHTSSSTFIFGGKIYVIGGSTHDRVTLRDVSIYDPATNAWSAGPNLLAPRMSPSAGVIGRQVIVSGGMAFGLNAQAETFTAVLG